MRCSGPLDDRFRCMPNQVCDCSEFTLSALTAEMCMAQHRLLPAYSCLAIMPACPAPCSAKAAVRGLRGASGRQNLQSGLSYWWREGDAHELR
jgi:hypothetical protein